MVGDGLGETVEGDVARWRGMFGNMGVDITVACWRFLVWMTILGFVESAPAFLKLPLTAVLVLVFLWRYGKVRNASPESPTFAAMLQRPAAVVRWHAIGLALLMFLTAPWVQGLLVALRAGFGDGSVASQLGAEKTPAVVVVLTFVVLAVTSAAAPLLEEFFVRGWLFAALRRSYSVHVTVLVTSAVFVLIHLSVAPDLVLMRFVFGIAVGYAAVATSSVWTAVAMHYAWDFSLAFFQSPGTRGIQHIQYLGITPTLSSVLLVSIACCLCCSLILVHAMRRRQVHAHERAWFF